MKICMISPFGFEAATTRVRAYNLAKNLARGGDEVLLIISGKMEKREGNLRVKGVWPQQKSAKDFMISMLSKYSALLRARDFDIYHSFKALPWASLPTWIAVRRRKKVIDLDDWETESAKLYSNRFYAVMIRNFEYSLPKLFDGVIIVSDRLMQECAKMGVPKDRMLKLPYGSDIEMFKPIPYDRPLAEKLGVLGKKVVLYIGGIGPDDTLLRVMKLVTQKVEGSVLLMVGKGGGLSMVKSRAQELGLNKNCIFVDYQPHERVPSFLSIADVVTCLCPRSNIDEARSPSKLGECMGAGKAIVATAVGVIKEQLSDGAGSLVYSDSIEEMASKIIEVLNDKELAKRLGQKAREKAEKTYSWEKLAQELREFYLKILES